ncbi:MAG: hypothetical protein ACOCQQ_01185 [Candidatus Nanoarchaeia archaeon]
MIRKDKKASPDKSILFERPKVRRPKSSFAGKSPNILIGEFGYPQVNVGTLSSEEYVAQMDTPKNYVDKNVSSKEILFFRQSLVNSLSKVRVKELQQNYVEQTQEIAKAKRAVDTQVELDRPLLRRMEFHSRSLPHGPSASLKKLTITENVGVAKSIERATSDTDALATTGLSELYDNSVDAYKLSSLLSAGTLGREGHRKLVPSKWAITAVDDLLGEGLRKEITEYSSFDFSVFSFEYIGNYYVILCLPGDWSFELLEYTQEGHFYNKGDGALLTQDHEFVTGRKTYAYETAGGYYASRLSVFEFCSRMKRQGRFIVYRVISKEYDVPLGVWTVRETVRKTLESAPISCETRSQAISVVLDELKKTISDFSRRESAQEFVAQSKVLREEQPTLKNWL